MAKLETSLDTETREFRVAMNGEDVSDVRCVELWNYKTFDEDGESLVMQPGFSVSVHTDAEGVSRHTHMTAERSIAEFFSKLRPGPV